MKCALICAALLCVLHGEASAQEKPATYNIATNAYQFDASTNTYSFEVRFNAIHVRALVTISPLTHRA
jgi:hypothetical protein